MSEGKRSDAEVAGLLKLATRVARSMDRDPVADDLAAEAVVHALNTYEESRGTIENWVHLLTKQAVIQEWRRRARRERTADIDWNNVSDASFNSRARGRRKLSPTEQSEQWVEVQLSMPADLGPEEHDEEWQILVEHEVLGWCVDVLAKRHGVTIYRMKKWLPEIELRYGVILAHQAGLSTRQIRKLIEGRAGRWGS